MYKGFTVKCLVLNHTDDADQNGQPKVREVTIPPEEGPMWDALHEVAKLDVVYHNGQNDFSEEFPEHNSTYSLSMADVICLPDREAKTAEGADDTEPDDVPYTNYVVCSCGFKPITDDELAELIAMPRRDRTFCDLVMKASQSIGKAPK